MSFITVMNELTKLFVVFLVQLHHAEFGDIYTRSEIWLIRKGP